MNDGECTECTMVSQRRCAVELAMPPHATPGKNPLFYPPHISAAVVPCRLGGVGGLAVNASTSGTLRGRGSMCPPPQTSRGGAGGALKLNRWLAQKRILGSPETKKFAPQNEPPGVTGNQNRVPISLRFVTKPTFFGSPEMNRWLV